MIIIIYENVQYQVGEQSFQYLVMLGTLIHRIDKTVVLKIMDSLPTSIVDGL